MSLLGTFKNYRKGQQIKSALKMGDVLCKMMTTKDQRAEVLDALQKLPPDIAVPQMMRRFDMVVDHGIVDRSEKETVVRYLCKYPELSKEIVASAVKTAKRVSWPIKIAEKLFDRTTYASLLLDSLSPSFVSFDEQVQERNIEILLALKDVTDDRVTDKVKPFISSRDESVRIAALECLETQGNERSEARDAIKSILELPHTDDNARLLGLVRGIVQTHGW